MNNQNLILEILYRVTACLRTGLFEYCARARVYNNVCIYNYVINKVNNMVIYFKRIIYIYVCQYYVFID